jgi:hypothetical protein
MGSFIVNADVPKNRLVWKAEGYLTDDEVQTAFDNIMIELDKLKPGFIVISNSPTFKPGSPKAVDIMKQIFVVLGKKGVKKTIGVTAESPVAKMQLDRTYKAGGISDHLFVGSLEEAENLAKSFE